MSSKKIAVCIPSYNEEDNIANITNIIDHALLKYDDYQITIVNCDSASTDKTIEIFKKTKTSHQKEVIINKEKGKGNNLISFFKYCKDNDIDYALTLDADLKSVKDSWIDNYLDAMIKENYNYVVPLYERSRYEGSTTNHFAYPLVYAVTGYNIRQPIAGDFGFDKKFINMIVNKKYNDSITRYGIDIYMTLNACLNDLKIKQIKLDKKIHAPSFNKMESMFLEVLDGALFTLKNNKLKKDIKYQKFNDKINILNSRKFNHKKSVKDFRERYKLDSNINVNEEWIKIMKTIVNNPNNYNEEDYLYIRKIFINRAVSYWVKAQYKSAYDCEMEIINQCKTISGR